MPQQNQQSRRDLERARLDAFSRMAVWGPIGLYAALGKEIPTPLKFISLGASILQISYGLRDFKRVTQQKQRKDNGNV